MYCLHPYWQKKGTIVLLVVLNSTEIQVHIPLSPKLPQYFDRARWLKESNSEAEELFRMVAEVFIFWAKSHVRKSLRSLWGNNVTAWLTQEFILVINTDKQMNIVSTKLSVVIVNNKKNKLDGGTVVQWLTLSPYSKKVLGLEFACSSLWVLRLSFTIQRA